MIIISDLNDSYIQEFDEQEAATIVGGKSACLPGFNVNINVALVPIIQINAFSNYSSNSANVDVKF